jgi:ABC-type nitrate/sulfonate/bicarbonate transport system substrate-binding protein
MNTIRLKRRDVLGAGAAALATLVLPGAAPRAQGALAPVRFTAGANLGYTNLFVAEGAGLFRKHGIDGRVILFDVAFLGTEAVLAGQADTATTAAFPMVNFVAKGADLICPAITITGDDIKIVALKTIAKPEDFIGKRVGLIVGSVANYGFDRYVQHHRLPKDKITVINVPAAEQVALFAKGDLDAFIWVEPVVSRGVEIMKGRAHVLDPGLEVVMRNRNYLQVKKSWAEKNPAVVLNILRAHIEASELIKANPALAAQHAGRKLNLPPDQIPELIRRAGFRWDVYLDTAQLAELKVVTDWMRENKRLAAEPGDLRRLMAPEYLAKVAPANVKGF